MRQPRGAALYEGVPYRIEVLVEGCVGGCTFNWKKDGTPVGTAAPYFDMTSATDSDAGEYWCTITDGYTTIDTDHVFIEVYPRAASGHHAADMDQDWQISLLELLRVIQFYNMGALHCQEGSEDGYAPGAGDTSCAAHDADYVPQDWQISLPELLRVVQFFNALGGAYHAEPGAEDGFAPQAG